MPFNTSTIRIDHKILSLIAEIDEFKGAWTGTKRLAPDAFTHLRRVASIESVGSSTRIEGARLRDSEVEKLLGNLNIQSFASRDEQEVAGYAQVMNLVVESFDAIAPTENHILQLHRDLLAHSTKDARHRGAYKTLPNHVEAFDESGGSVGVVFATASPLDTPRLMAELVDWFIERAIARDMHPLLAIAIFVVVFLEIHPFQDGNGRLSRALTTLLLLRAGYAHVPYSSLERVIERNKDAYYLALRRTQATIRTESPDWNPWIEFFLWTLQRQKEALNEEIKLAASMNGDLPELSALILDVARRRGRVTVAGAVKISGRSRNTVKDHLKALTAAGALKLHGAGRGAWYGLG